MAPSQTPSSQDHDAFMAQENSSTSESTFPVPPCKRMLHGQAAMDGDLQD